MISTDFLSLPQNLPILCQLPPQIAPILSPVAESLRRFPPSLHLNIQEQEKELSPLNGWYSHLRSANLVIRLRLQLAVSCQMDEVAGAPVAENDCRGVDTL